MQDELFYDDDNNDETIDDVEASESDLRNAVMYHTDWTVETLVSQIRKGRIDLSPEFQRREAWNSKAKSLLIESVLLNFPIPAITLAERSREATFVVVDGKQRLSSISQFLGEMPGTKYNSFKLSGLPQLKHLNGLSYEELCRKYPKEASIIENYSVRTNVIRGWKNDQVLFSIFHRLNSGSVKLSPQELRQSLHPGEFTKFITRYCDTSVALRDIFPGSEPDFRMRDVELAIRYLSISLFIENYSGDLKRQLDFTVERLNDGWPAQKSTVEALLKKMEDCYAAAENAFGRQNVFKKWDGSNWETRTNRAIFDAIMYAGLSDEVIFSMNNSPTDVVQSFQNVSLKKDFKESVERTTKTVDALFTRIHLFCEELREAGIDAPKIQLVGNRIMVVRP